MFLDLHRPVLSVGQVAGTLIDLQGALTRAFTLILLHSEEEKTEELILKAVLRQFLEIFLIKKNCREFLKNVQKMLEFLILHKQRLISRASATYEIIYNSYYAMTSDLSIG